MKGLSFSIENILNKEEKRKEKFIIPSAKAVENIQFSHHVVYPVHTVKLSNLVNYYGSNRGRVTTSSKCDCKQNGMNDTAFREKLKVRRIGHPYKSRAPPKRKPCRNSFTNKQVGTLEKLFQQTKYLSSAERLRVANELKMTDNQLKTWYQNRRTKLKREINEMNEQRERMNIVNPTTKR